VLLTPHAISDVVYVHELPAFASLRSGLPTVKS
jgi:hypothetical protein